MATFTLLNTRPEHQAESLNKLLEAVDAQGINCPVMQIKWLANSIANEPEIEPFDKAIFSSVNAVIGWQKQAQPAMQKTLFNDVFAIGQATQKKGLASGLAIQCLSDQQFDSEHLLAQPVMQQVANERIALIKGLNGRSLLTDTLAQRGATVVPIEVYQRVESPFCEQAWLSFLEAEKPVLLVSSVESWLLLMKQLQDYYADIATTQTLLKASFWQNVLGVIVMSQRIANEIQQQGWQRPVVVVKTQSNDGIIKAAQTFV